MICERWVWRVWLPHNSNGSNGQMFKLEDWAGDPLDDAYAEQRMRNEPVVEITQVKGTSRPIHFCLPVMSLQVLRSCPIGWQPMP